MSPLEIAAVVASVAGVWLTVRRHPLCWPVSLLSVILYARVFFEAKLYSDMLLQGVFGAFALYGWWQWRKGLGDDGRVRVLRLSRFGLAAGLAAGAAGSAALGLVMATRTDAAVPWLDASLTCFSLVAQYWAARKYIESWWMWIAVDIVYTGLFLSRDLTLTAILYAAFIGLAVQGLRDWRTVGRRQDQSGETPDGPLHSDARR